MYTKTWYDCHESQSKDNGKWRLVDLHWNKAMGTVMETWQKEGGTVAEAKDEKKAAEAKGETQADEVKDEQQADEVKTVDEALEEFMNKNKPVSKRFRRGVLGGKKKAGMTEQA